MLVVACVVAVVSIGVYLGIYYHADTRALASLKEHSDAVTVDVLDDGSIAFVSKGSRMGFAFYPGAKVEMEAYAPLMCDICERGITCVIVRVPHHLALLAPDAADHVLESCSDIDTWLVGGHSLGGLVASRYVARHSDEVDGLVLLASYPTDDLTSFEGKVLTMVGTNDGVIRRERLEEARALLPRGSEEVTIEGGNHAQFGDYGKQAADGASAISSAEQQRITADAVERLAREVAASGEVARPAA